MKLVVQFKSLSDLLHQLQDATEEKALTASTLGDKAPDAEIPVPVLRGVAPELIRLLSHPEIERLMRIAPDEDAETDVMLPYILFESAEAASN